MPTAESNDIVRSLSSKGIDVHAVLFYGFEGGPQRNRARRLAQAWLCTNPSGDGPCRECSVCLSVERGGCVDLLFIEPLGPSQVIKNSAITPDDSSKGPDAPIPVTEFLRTRPLAASRKVVLIERCERLTDAAASALLKTLEEPGLFARLVLTSNAIGAVTSTIRSRCLVVRCPLEELSTNLDEDAEVAEAALLFAEGSSGLVERVVAFAEPYRHLLRVCRAIETALPPEALKWAEELREIGDEFQKTGDWTARAADVEVLRALGAWARTQNSGTIGALVAEAHRFTVGNVNFGLVTDALVARILQSRST